MYVRSLSRDSRGDATSLEVVEATRMQAMHPRAVRVGLESDSVCSFDGSCDIYICTHSAIHMTCFITFHGRLGVERWRNVMHRSVRYTSRFAQWIRKPDIKRTLLESLGDSRSKRRQKEEISWETEECNVP